MACTLTTSDCNTLVTFQRKMTMRGHGDRHERLKSAVKSEPSKHCSTGTIPAQYQGYCRNGTGPPLFYCHLRNSDLPFCTSAFYRSGTGKLLPYRYQPAQLYYIASTIYAVAWCWASTTPVQNLLWACHWLRTIQPMSG